MGCIQTHGSLANWYPHIHLIATGGGFRPDGTFVPWPAHDTAPQPVAEPVPLALREARRRWAELLRQIFEVDPLRCPACGAEMRIVAFITQRAVIDRMLDHLRRASESARGPPRAQRRPRLHARRQGA